MELESLSLRNFRQFRDATIEFSRDEDRNVTVVHGDNGSGKTTLLNAFTWVLYGEVDFETGTSQLANEGVMATADASDIVVVSATLTFYHDDTHYRATREIPYKKQTPDDLAGTPGESTTTLEYLDDGEYHIRNNPDTRLEQILPERLRSLFFFDGEDIDQLAEAGNQDRIQEAIRNIMGLTILERSIRHLDEVSRRFRTELKDIGDEELSELLDEQEKVERQLAQKREQLDAKRAVERDLEHRINDIGATLEGLEESRTLENELREAERRKDELETEREEVEGELHGHFTKHGMLAFALPALRETAADLDALRSNDLLGTGVTQDFLDTLLDREQCICGRPLDESSIYHERVADLEPSVDAEGVGEHAVRTLGHLDLAEDRYEELHENLEALLARHQEIDGKIEQAVEVIDEREMKLSRMDVTPGDGQEAPAELQQEREAKREELKDVAQDIGAIKNQILELESEKEDLDQQLGDARQKQDKTERIRRRWKATVETKHNLESSFDKLQQTVRKLVNDTVSTKFDAIAHKDEDDLHAAINEEFELEGRKQVGDQYEQVDMSRGERQIASLTFIGSLVYIARRRYEKHADAQYFSGGIYPIVMDSPFGTLDNTHRRHVSREIPKLAKQVVVFATDAQWEGPVAEELEQIAGAQYRLELNEDEEQLTGTHPETDIVSERAPAMSRGVSG